MSKIFYCGGSYYLYLSGKQSFSTAVPMQTVLWKRSALLERSRFGLNRDVQIPDLSSSVNDLNNELPLISIIETKNTQYDLECYVIWNTDAI